MAASLDRQFIGQARLARLLFWKVGDSTDIDACLAAALEQGMIDADDHAFLAEQLSAEETARESGEAPPNITSETIARLRRCVDKLNRADCA